MESEAEGTERQTGAAWGDEGLECGCVQSDGFEGWSLNEAGVAIGTFFRLETHPVRPQPERISLECKVF